MSVFTQLYDFISSMDHSMRHFEDVSVVALCYAITIDKLRHSVFFYFFLYVNVFKNIYKVCQKHHLSTGKKNMNCL